MLQQSIEVPSSIKSLNVASIKLLQENPKP